MSITLESSIMHREVSFTPPDASFVIFIGRYDIQHNDT